VDAKGSIRDIISSTVLAFGHFQASMPQCSSRKLLVKIIVSLNAHEDDHEQHFKKNFLKKRDS